MPVALRIDAEQAAARIKTFVHARVTRAGAAGGVLGLSGGLDSATVAYLAVGALGPDRVSASPPPLSHQQRGQCGRRAPDR